MREQRDRHRLARTGLSLATGALLAQACSAPEGNGAAAALRAEALAATVDMPGAAPDAVARGPFASCDALLDGIRAGLHAEVRARVELARLWPGATQGPLYFGGVDSTLLGPLELKPLELRWRLAPLPFEPARPVQQGDVIRIDQGRTYVLHDQGLLVIDSSEGALRPVAAVPIEGTPLELLPNGERLVVFSRIDGPAPGTEARYAEYAAYSPSFTKISVLDLASVPPQVVREVYAEGNYMLSRLAGGVVSAAVQQFGKVRLEGPSIDHVDFFGHPYTQAAIDGQLATWAALVGDSIEDATLGDFLPLTFEKVGDALVEQPPACEQQLVPAVLTELGALRLLRLDLEQAAAPLAEAAVLGYSDGVYVDEDAAVMWRTHRQSWPGEPRAESHLHTFALDGASARWTASGSVSGVVPPHPHSVDEDRGVLRVIAQRELFTTTEEGSLATAGHESRVVTLGHSEDGRSEASRRSEDGRSKDAGGEPAAAAFARLVELGSAVVARARLATFASRFVGNRGYVLTMPEEPAELVVVDLADPTEPLVTGRLAPGSYASAFLPLPGEHLLSVGQAGLYRDPPRATLQLLDASDPAAPRIAAEHGYAAAESDATLDGRAISVDPSSGLLTFPLHRSDGTSTLELAGLSGAAKLELLGSVLPEPPPLTLPRCLAQLGYDAALLAEIAADEARASALLEECAYAPLLPVVRRGLLDGDRVLVLTDMSLASYGLETLEGPPSAQLDFDDVR